MNEPWAIEKPAKGKGWEIVDCHGSKVASFTALEEKLAEHIVRAVNAQWRQEHEKRVRELREPMGGPSPSFEADSTAQGRWVRAEGGPL